MPTAAFTTLGCKVNQYETQQILDSFEARGFAIGELNAPADVYVVNTCSVTQTAEHKSRQMVRRLARLSPDAVVVMTGCYGEMARIKGEPLAEAALVVPNADKLRALEYVLTAFPGLAPSGAGGARTQARNGAGSRTRATLKVQDGCNVRCSFCSIPYTRHVMASRPATEVLAEAHRLAEDGYREIVATGVLVGSYRPETGSGGPDLADLLRALAHVPGIERVRLSSIEPTQVTERLLATFRHEPRLCRHLHIPLQSGDTDVLRRMNRPYSRDHYLALCERAYRALPGLAITTDIMVGFPGETREAFRNTLDVVARVGFGRAHIFRYSARPMTPAAGMDGGVPEPEKEARAHTLADACRQAQQHYVARYLGRTLGVLVEGKDHGDGLLAGYTENYIRVLFTGGSHLIGTIAPVQLQEPSPDGARGEAQASYQPEADLIPITTVAGSVAARP